MSKRNWSNILSVLARIALAFVFVFGQTAWAIQAQNPKDKPTSNAAAKPKQAQENGSTAAGPKAQFGEEENASEESSSGREGSHSGGHHEGIKVHGHWTIEVRNADGSLATHREFENSLAQNSALLSSFLSRTYSVGAWFVLLEGNVCSTSRIAVSCSIVEPVWGVAVPGEQFLTLTVTNSGPNLVLSGTATATLSGSIAAVQTLANACPATTSPSSPCNPNGVQPSTSFVFTNATLTTAIQVSAGQTIAVTVNISFS